MEATLTEKQKAEVIVKDATKDAGTKPIQSDQDRAAYSVSPERQVPQYD